MIKNANDIHELIRDVGYYNVVTKFSKEVKEVANTFGIKSDHISTFFRFFDENFEFELDKEEEYLDPFELTSIAFFDASYIRDEFKDYLEDYDLDRFETIVYNGERFGINFCYDASVNLDMFVDSDFDVVLSINVFDNEFHSGLTKLMHGKKLNDGTTRYFLTPEEFEVFVLASMIEKNDL